MWFFFDAAASGTCYPAFFKCCFLIMLCRSKSEHALSENSPIRIWIWIQYINVWPLIILYLSLTIHCCWFYFYLWYNISLYNHINIRFAKNIFTSNCTLLNPHKMSLRLLLWESCPNKWSVYYFVLDPMASNDNNLLEMSPHWIYYSLKHENKSLLHN